MSNSLDTLMKEATTKKLEVVMPVKGSGSSKHLVLEVRDKTKTIDFEKVRKTETPEAAAVRLRTRLKTARVL